MADNIDGPNGAGSSGGNIAGMAEFRKALRSMGEQYPKKLRQINKDIADIGADYSQAEAFKMGGIWAKAAKGIKGKASQKDARIGVTTGKSTPFAGAAFWGMKRRTGWYGGLHSPNGAPQHPPWVGNTWAVAVKGQGPYAINTALADHLDDILKVYSDAIEALMNEALPPWRQAQMRRGIN
jgi:hypothetical protein